MSVAGSVRSANPPGLVRPRLLAALGTAQSRQLTLLVAPAGAGKTTLLAQYAATHTGPVAWYRADPTDAASGVAVDRLHAALASLADLPPTRTYHLDELLAALSSPSGASRALLVDNLDSLEGSAAERTLERLALLAPPTLRVLGAGRRIPAVNLLRHELSDRSTVLEADQFRFRTWEVERLLRDVYREPLPPEEVAVLTRRTGGWAAGLQLFHLSTRGRTLPERRRAVGALDGRSALARAYLTSTVLADLPDDARDFVIRTSVFDVVTAERCDRLLGTTDSERRLDEMERRHALPTSNDGGRTYRYHEVLRSHLVGQLVELLGEAGARRWHARAAALLAGDGAYAEAVRAYARAGDWPAVRRLLSRVGGAVIDEPSQPWDDVLQPALLAEDPWLTLAEARRRFSEGQLATAVDRYRLAESLFIDESGKERCRQERRVAAVWLPGEAHARVHWAAWLRAATRRHPALVASEAAGLPGTAGDLVRLASNVLSGDLIGQAARATPDPADTSFSALGLRLLQAAVSLAAGIGSSRFDLEQIAGEAEASGFGWLSRVARAATALAGDENGAAEAASVAAECARHEDGWGEAVATTIGQLALPPSALDLSALTRLAQLCRELDAGVLEAWAQAFLALACAAGSLPDAELETRRAESLARHAGVPGAQVVALAAAARLDPGRRRSLVREARIVAGALGIPARTLDLWIGEPAAPSLVTVERTAPISVWCFGGFRMAIGDQQLDLSPIRPRARTALHLLALRAGQPVHREALIEALWADLSPEAATRNMQVAISTLRSYLEPERERGKAQLVVRAGEAYTLALPAGAYADTVVFTEALDRWRQARITGDEPAAVQALRSALAAYGGELLPEDGPAEWLLRDREVFRRQAANASCALAGAELDEGDMDEAARVAEQCVAIDPYHDAGWHVLLQAYIRSGERAAAEQARRRYAAVLASLGLAGDASPGRPGEPQLGRAPVSRSAPPPPGQLGRSGGTPPVARGGGTSPVGRTGAVGAPAVTLGRRPPVQQRRPDGLAAHRRPTAG